jgi:hypothetical protein
VTWYSVLTVLLALVSLIAQLRIERNPRSSIELARGSDPRTSGESMAERDHPLPVSATPNTPIR